MTARRGRADLHIHTLASDGTSGIIEILDHVERGTQLDVIAITDHERIDAALAARAIARDRGMRVQVIVGEEITTRGGHLLGLFLEQRIRPLRSLRSTIAEIHDHGGIAIPAHPLVPFPLCAQGFALRRLLDESDERHHPDGLETFNPTTLGRPWHGRVIAFANQSRLARIGNSDAHVASSVGVGWTSFPGLSPEDLRRAIEARTTESHGTFHGSVAQLSTFGAQLRKYGRDAHATVRGRILRDGTRRDLGYPAHRREASG